MSTKRERSNLNFQWLLWWKLNPEDLKIQVDNYQLLKITQSYRGVACMLLLFSVALTTFLVMINSVDTSALLDAAVLLMFAFFIYKGYKWAILGAMLLWTYEKGYQLIQSTTNQSSPIIPIIWWSTYMAAFYAAFKVEQLRSKNQ